MGDSTSVVSVKGQPSQLSEDHKSDGESEKNRIEAAEGYIMPGKINELSHSVSRAIGDFYYKDMKKRS